MKRLLFVLSVLSISSAAMAMHAYGEDDCMTFLPDGTKLEISLENGRPSGAHYIHVDNDTRLYVNFDRVENDQNLGGDVGPKDADLILISKKDSAPISQDKLDDGCFQGDKSTFTRNVTVDTTKSTVTKLFKVTQGMKLQFVCYDMFQAPTGSHCGE